LKKGRARAETRRLKAVAMRSKKKANVKG